MYTHTHTHTHTHSIPQTPTPKEAQCLIQYAIIMFIKSGHMLNFHAWILTVQNQTNKRTSKHDLTIPG